MGLLGVSATAVHDSNIAEVSSKTMSEATTPSAKTLKNRRKRERKRLKEATSKNANISGSTSNGSALSRLPLTAKRKRQQYSADVEENIFAHYADNDANSPQNYHIDSTHQKKHKNSTNHNNKSVTRNPNASRQDSLAVLSRAKSKLDSAIAHQSNVNLGDKSVISDRKARKRIVTDDGYLPVIYSANSNPSPAACNNAEAHVYENLQNRDEISFQRKSLPVFAVRKQLMSLFAKENCMILKGETACGKTTQIPQFILEGGFTSGKAIAITQPRRVAAMSIAERVAVEVGTQLGKKVGYCIRFEDVTSGDTKIKYVTDGMLLRESISDPLLTAYSWVILDEAHERTINTDVLLGVVKIAQSKRSSGSDPLKIIIMSATIDEDKLINYFNEPVVFQIPGREFVIEIHNSTRSHDDYFAMTLSTVFHIHQNNDKGDILVFLTGEEEIESALEETRKIMVELTHPELELYPCQLYAALPFRLQQMVLKPALPTQRKVIFSTNIAETSLTIPGIKYVVDTGMVKSKTFNPVSGLDLLKVQKISKAQADQRSGRAGRECRGACYRLYTLEEYQALMDFPVPEIQRCNLANVVLQLVAIGITDVKNFDFLDKPSEENMDAAIEQLRVLDAVDGECCELSLTDLGKKMVKFPLDPRFSKIVINSPRFKCTDEILTIISLLSVESVFTRTTNEKEQFFKVRKRFCNGEGDHIMLLNLYKAFRISKTGKGWCLMHSINFKSMKKTFAIRKQLAQICQKVKIPPCSCGPDTSSVRKCLATGLFMNSAHLYKDRIYKTIGSKEKVFIHPTSSMFRSKLSCCIYTDLVETTKRYMRNVSVVDEDWLLEAAPDYFKEHRFNRFELMSV